MDAIYDAAAAMDDLYLQHLLSDLECHELIVWPIRIVADSILKISIYMLFIDFNQVYTFFFIREFKNLLTFRLIAIVIVDHC